MVGEKCVHIINIADNNLKVYFYSYLLRYITLH